MSNDTPQEEEISHQEAKRRERRANNPTPQEVIETEVEILKRGEKIIIVENEVEREATPEEVEKIIQAEAEANAPKFAGKVLCAGPPPGKIKDPETGEAVKDAFGKDALFKRKFSPEEKTTPYNTFEDSKGKGYVQMMDGSVRRR